MAKEKPAEMRSLKKLDESKTANVEGVRKRPSMFAVFQSVMFFVGGFGRVLRFIDYILEWLSDSS